MGLCASNDSISHQEFIRNKVMDRTTLSGFVGPAYCCSVYDGDTFDIIFKKGGVVQRRKVRLLGIDCPELKPKLTAENRAQVVKKAVAARDYVSSQILDKRVMVSILADDKYGRPLVKVTYNKMDLATTMIELGYGVPYDGKTKVV